MILLSLTALARAPLGPLPLEWPEAPHVQLTVKLDDALGATAIDGVVHVRACAACTPAPLLGLHEVALARGLRFRPLIAIEPARLAALRARAIARTGEDAPDLGALFIVDVPGGDLVAAAEALSGLDGVAYVHLHGSGWAPPEDIAPPTDDRVEDQEWLDEDPGIHATYAHGRGYRGSRVGIADCEYDWNEDHEDLVDVDLGRERGARSPGYTEEYGYDQHGTAVAGMIVGADNGYGILGAAPDAQMTTWPEVTTEDDNRRVTAIANAVAAAEVGDVVMLEMQGYFRPGGDYAPAEVDPEVYEVVRTATDAGVIVVAAAGNGAEDLDSAWYQSNWIEWGDSGAIIVGAGTADDDHEPLYFTSYGERVNVQGWGIAVFTTGYGDAYAPGNDIDQGYTWFSGTSSATPMVGASAVLIQDFLLAHGLPPLDAWGMRELLTATGIPQGRGENIGPIPDVAAAFAVYDADEDDHIAEALGGDDCDDDDATVNPDADPDDEEPGLDLNCDGETPEPEEVKACGCDSQGTIAAPLAGMVVLLARRRRSALAR